LEVSVLARLESVEQVAVVPVLGRGDEDRVEVLAVEELPIVGVPFGLRPGNLETQLEIHPIDVAHGAPLRPQGLEVVHVAAAHAACADDPHHDPVVRSEHLGAERGVRKYAQPHRAAAHEFSPRHTV